MLKKQKAEAKGAPPPKILFKKIEELDRKIEKEGVTGKELEFFHPLSYGGYWEKEANSLGFRSPREEREVRRRLAGNWYW